MEKAIRHSEVALGIASSFNWRNELFWLHQNMAALFLHQGGFDDAQAHIESIKSYVVCHAYYLGLAMELQAGLWCKQDGLEEGRSKALRAADVHEKLGAAKDIEDYRQLLRWHEEE